MSDSVQPLIEDMGSGTRAEETQDGDPRVIDDANRENVIVDSSMHTASSVDIHPVTDESIPTEVEEESTKCDESDHSVVQPLVEKNPNKTNEASILQLESTSRTVERIEHREDGVSPTEEVECSSTEKELAPVQMENEAIETEQHNPSSGSVVEVDNESSCLSAVNKPSEGVVLSNSDTVGKSQNDEIKSKDKDDVDTSEVQPVILEELDTNESEGTKVYPKKRKLSEESGEPVDENDVEVIEGTTVTNNERIGQTNVVSDTIDESHLPRKRGRKPKRNRSECVIVENGSPERAPDVGSTDEVSPARPRRKAAQKAGDQIKQIVGSEEDVSEGNERGKGAEEWMGESNTPPRKICYQCCRLRPCQYHLLVNGVSRYMCTNPCFQAFRRQHPPKPSGSGIVVKESTPLSNELDSPMVDVASSGDSRLPMDSKGSEVKDYTLECAYCHCVVPPPTASEKSLSWETMEFCNEGCLGKYQDQLSSCCSHCKVPVQKISMGKYCVRFGYHIKQFCCSTCLEEFKKGLKTCTYCQKDISNGAEGFLAPVGDKGQFKDFCTPACMEQYDHISSGTRPPPKEAACAVCDKVRPVISEVVTRRPKKDQDVPSEAPPVYSLCSEPCFAAFKFVNEVKTEQCESCLRYFDTAKPEEKPTIFFHDGGYHCCCRACLNIFILTRRSIVQCNWCRVKKYDFDMIKRISSSGQVLMMCSLNCLSLYHVSISAVSSRRVKCDYCDEYSQAQYHLTMSDATVRNFCSYDCVMAFQSQYSKTPLTLPEEDTISVNAATGPSSNQKVQLLTVQSGPVPAAGVDPTMPPPPIISSVQSLAPEKNGPKEVNNSTSGNLLSTGTNHAPINSSKVTTANGLAYRQVIVKPPSLKEVKNKSTSCQPITLSKSVECHPSSVDMSTQTDENFLSGPILIPVPVPIYVPMPIGMYSYPLPVPTPFPLPLPVPIVVPSKLTLKEIVQKSKELSSVAPEEAEILMMAELVASDEKDYTPKRETRTSTSPTDEYFDTFPFDSVSDPEVEESQEPILPTVPSLSDASVDLEESIAITKVPGPAFSEDETSADEHQKGERSVGRKRKAGGSVRGGRTKRSNPSSSASTVDSDNEDDLPVLKASLGVSAWQVWVQQKNSELSKVTSHTRRLKLFKTELLQMTLEELNFALCLFVKEVRKPGGGMYAPDTILYFCLGIQHYLMENGRVDNIFTDLYFEKFTECLDQVATTFPPLTKETKLIATRVEEEHLWESRQLGAHSPYVLLSTLVFFNTKYFRLWTVEDHAKLTFANVIKVWKKPRGARQAASGGTEHNSSLLRLIHHEKVIDKKPAQKKNYDQHENTTIPIRCPVKHYEFYLSKCPDPLKKVGDVFYLLPERACVPDSPVWYSSTALGPDALGKILHRIQMVKEVNKSYVEEFADNSSVDELEESASEKEEVV